MIQSINKKTEKILTGKEKHEVLLFGKRTFGEKALNLDLDFCNIEKIPFPTDYDKLKKLSNYSLVILDYSVFLGDNQTSGYTKEQEVFKKSMLEAFDSGTCFCILHYDEIIPDYGRPSELDKYRSLQIGLDLIYDMDIRAVYTNTPLLSSNVRKNEFKKYIVNWGSTKIYFHPYGTKSLESLTSDIIADIGENEMVAFSQNISRGKLIYIPCIRDFSRPKILIEMFTTLIDALITYLSKSRIELPDWAKAPLFNQEKKVFEEKEKLEIKLKEYDNNLEVFLYAKQLLFQSEYGLEDSLPIFLEEQLKILTEREERYKEDFWLLDHDEKKVVICEAKSYVKGFRKSGLFSIFNHREEYNLDENFPAVLFVNANLNANSMKEKNRKIDTQDYKEASDKNILVVRIEDLIFAWQAILEGVLDINELLKIFTTEVGWLNFKGDNTWKVFK